MNCQNRIMYSVQAGDSLYQLARRFDTTVTDLILGNPGVNPYNLQVGMRLNICPGPNFSGEVSDMMPNTESGMNRPEMPGMPGMPEMNRPPMPGMPGMNRPPMPGMPGMNLENNEDKNENESPNEKGSEVEELVMEMRMAWLDFAYWTRIYLMSVAAGSNDQKEVEEQLVEVADEITDIFAEFLPIAATRQLRNLLAEHVELTSDLIRMQFEENMQNYDAVVQAWYENGNQIAELFEQINPYFAGKETRNLLLNYLDMTRAMIEQQKREEYGESLDTFRDIRKHVIEMANFFVRGLLAR